MIEKNITIDSIDPLMLFGTNDSNLKLIKNSFPKVKIVARGNDIKVNGEVGEVNEFIEKIGLFTQFIERYSKLNKNDIIEILKNASDGLTEIKETENGVIVYGNYGKQIKARTVNQQKLVDEYKNNDLLFAIGPAGTGKTYTAIALAVRAWRKRR